MAVDMSEEKICKGIEILQNVVKDNRTQSKQFIIGENELIATLNALHKAIDIEKELQREKEKNKKLEDLIDMMAEDLAPLKIDNKGGVAWTSIGVKEHYFEKIRENK